MSKLHSWREASAVAVDPNQTRDYIPLSQASTGNNANVNQTVANNPYQTRDYYGNSTGTGYVDPQIATAASELKTTHNTLRKTFGNLRSKISMIQPPQMAKAFDQKLIGGIDAIGAAHAIINPLAQGIQQDS